MLIPMDGDGLGQDAGGCCLGLSGASDPEGLDERQIESMLQDSQARFAAVFDRAAIGIALVGIDEVIIEGNPALARMLGYDARELKGKSWKDLIDPGDASLHKAAYTELLAGLKDSHQAEVRFQPRTGKLRQGRVTVSVVRGPDLAPGYIVALLEDITERKEMEDRLKLTEREVSTLLDSIPAYAFLKDAQGRFITANRKFCDAAGVSRSEIAGKTDYDITSRSLADRYAEEDRRVLTTGEPVFWDGPWAERGRAMSVETTKLPLKGERGRIIGVIGLVYDITERQRMEEALRESEENYRALFEESPVALLIEDFSAVKATLDSMAGKGIPALRRCLSGHPEEIRALVGKVKLLDANSATVRLFEAEQKEELDNLYRILSDEAIDGFVDRFVALAEGRREFEVETVNKTLKGRPIQVVVRYIVPPGSERTYSRVIVSIVDLTRIKKDEEALRQSEEQYRELVEYARSIIIKQDREGRILSFNEYAEEFFGFEEEEIIGKGIVGTIVPERESTGRDLKPLIEDIFARPEKYANNVNENMRKDGSRVWVHWSNRVAKDPDGRTVVVSVGTDITDRKLMEEDLMRSSSRLEELVGERTKELNETNRQLLKAERMAAIGSVAAQVGHDLRNPLTAVRTNLFYVEGVLPAAEKKKLSSTFRSMDESISYANRIISDLFDYSKKAKLKSELLELGDAIGGTLKRVSLPGGVKVVTHFVPDAYISGDISYLTRVFQNLIFNASDAMAGGGTLTIKTEIVGSKVVASFKDTGAGISKENMGKLFTPFFTTKAKGTGLGLSICQRLVEAHHGRIAVDSEVGKGTTFTLYFPLRRPRR
jgi:PAS domain S-box-containing protein